MAERPRVYKTEGIILRRRNVGEADSIFTVLSPREGKFDAVARGVRKARSHMRGHLEPLTHANLMIAQGRSLDVFTQAQTVEPYLALREDLDRSAVAIYAAELVDRFLEEREPAVSVFTLLADLFHSLDCGAPVHVLRFFELHLLSIAGYEVQVERCAVCGARLEPEPALLSGAAGGLVCYACRGAAGAGRLVSVQAIKVLRFARTASFTQFANLRMDDSLTAELQRGLHDFIVHVLEAETRSGKYVDAVSALPARSSPAERPGIQ